MLSAFLFIIYLFIFIYYLFIYFYLLFIYLFLFIIYLFISIALKKKKETDQLLEKTDINILFRFPLSCGIWEMHYKSFFVFGLWHRNWQSIIWREY